MDSSAAVKPLYKTIVVPTDCSELSRRALRYADGIASRTGAKVIAVYGERFSARMEGEGIAASLACSDDLEWMEMPIRQEMSRILGETLSSGTEREVVIADDEAAAAVIGVADRRHADLVVIETHDRNRLMRAVFGSVTDTVLRDTNRPVLILREHNDFAAHQAIRRILCPFRDSPASRLAFTHASSLAGSFGAELVLVHMVQDESREEPLPSWIDAGTASLRKIQIGNESGNRIVALADETGADLIVLGTSHRRFSDPDAGAPASRIVHTAHCPVLAVTI